MLLKIGWVKELGRQELAESIVAPARTLGCRWNGHGSGLTTGRPEGNIHKILQNLVDICG